MPQQMRDDLAAAARALAGFDRMPTSKPPRHAHQSSTDAARPRPRPAGSASGGTLPTDPVWTDIHYAWELEDAEGEWQAGGSANRLEDVQREGNRCLQTYSQDGPHKLIIQATLRTYPPPRRRLSMPATALGRAVSSSILLTPFAP
jgi:hypothetical protein